MALVFLSFPCCKNNPSLSTSLHTARTSWLDLWDQYLTWPRSCFNQPCRYERPRRLISPSKPRPTHRFKNAFVDRSGIPQQNTQPIMPSSRCGLSQDNATLRQRHRRMSPPLQPHVPPSLPRRAYLFTTQLIEHLPWSKTDEWPKEEREVLKSMIERESYCNACRAAKAAPDYQSRVETLFNTYLYCTGCKADLVSFRPENAKGHSQSGYVLAMRATFVCVCIRHFLGARLSRP